MIKKPNSEQKLEIVLTGQKLGKTKEAIAAELGYKSWRGIDVLMRRKGYIYKNGSYILSSELRSANLNNEIPADIKMVLEEIESGNKDLSDIALKVGFKDRKSLAEHLRNHGWLWCSQENTYLNENHKIHEFRPKLEHTATKQDQKPWHATLKELETTKSINLNELLTHIIQDFCKETGMSQQEILDRALIQIV